MRTLLALGCALAALTVGGAAQAAPNVLLVITDDQRADTLDAMPTVLAEIGAKGAVYPDSFVVNPTCCPSRVATFTGKYSHSTGFYSQSSVSSRISLEFSRLPQLAGWLHAAGYQTALIGKYLNGYDGSFVVPGWDRFVTVLHPVDYFGYSLYSDGLVTQRGFEPEDYGTDVLAAEADAFVRSADPARPLFLVFAPNAPHGQSNGSAPVPAPRHPVAPVIHDPPSLGEDLSDKPAWLRRLAQVPQAQDPAEYLAAMRATLAAVDEAVARLLAALEDTDRLEDTLVVFTSDNGLVLGEHRLGIRKRVPHEESIRVPLAVRWDGHSLAFRLAANIDIAPTIMEAAGLPFTGDGRSLLSRNRSDLLVEGVGIAVPTYCALRTAREKYIVYRDGSQELYDLAADPFELDNIRNRERRYDLRRRLADLCRPVPPRFKWPSVCTKQGDRRDNVLRGTRHFDVICAGQGNDRIDVRDGRRDVVVCGSGRDTVRADRHDEPRKDCERVLRRR